MDDNVESSPDDFPWDLGVFDAHCHPTDTMSSIREIRHMRARGLTIMATRAQDQDLVHKVASDESPTSGNDATAEVIVPSFGWHPWFSHHLFDDRGNDQDPAESKISADAKIKHYREVLNPSPDDDTFILKLPDPRSLSSFLAETEERFVAHPSALLGEVGLDKAFRIPEAWLPREVEERDSSLTPGGREGRHLSPYRVQMHHQQAVLLAQLSLAAKLRRAVSCHGVQAHGVLFETLHETWKGWENASRSRRAKKDHASVEKELHETGDHVPYPPRICLHSYSGPPDTLKQYLSPSVPVQFFFSFSIVINFSSAAAAKTERVIRSLPDDRILVESDLHIAGARMDENLEAVVRKVCELKEWELKEGVIKLHNNWRNFVSSAV